MKQTWLQEVLDEDAVAQTSGESGVAGGPCGSRECGVLGAGRGQGALSLCSSQARASHQALTDGTGRP